MKISEKSLKIELVILWMIPVISTIVSVIYWRHAPAYLAYLWLISVTCVFIVVGVGISYFHFWEWRTSIMPRFVFLHRLFAYAAYANLFFVIVGTVLVRATTVWSVLEAALLVGIISMIVGVVQEYICVDADIYVIHASVFSKTNDGIMKLVSSYAYYYFALLGLVMGAGAKVGHWYLVESPQGLHWIFTGIIVGCIASAPFLIWWGVLAASLKKRLNVSHALKILKTIFYSVCILFLGTALFIFVTGMRDTAKPSDVIVILGNKVEADGGPSARLRSRLDTGVELYKKKTAPLIVVSGGLGKEGFSEAGVMHAYLVDHGVPAADIIVDDHGLDTYQSAYNTAALMKERNLHSVVIVSNYYHIARTVLAFKNMGIQNISHAHGRYFSERDFYSIPREVVAYYYYAVRSYPADLSFSRGGFTMYMERNILINHHTMPTINPHINFNGNAEEAFTFYKSVFGGEFAKITRWNV